jgi:hypothetical protein
MLTEAFTPPHKLVAKVRLKGIHVVVTECVMGLGGGIDQPGIRRRGAAVVKHQHGWGALRNRGAMLCRISLVQDSRAVVERNLFASIRLAQRRKVVHLAADRLARRGERIGAEMERISGISWCSVWRVHKAGSIADASPAALGQRWGMAVVGDGEVVVRGYLVCRSARRRSRMCG